MVPVSSYKLIAILVSQSGQSESGSQFIFSTFDLKLCELGFWPSPQCWVHTRHALLAQWRLPAVKSLKLNMRSRASLVIKYYSRSKKIETVF